MNEGRVWARGTFSGLCERFGIGAARVSTDKPEMLANALKDLERMLQVSSL